MKVTITLGDIYKSMKEVATIDLLNNVNNKKYWQLLITEGITSFRRKTFANIFTNAYKQLYKVTKKRMEELWQELYDIQKMRKEHKKPIPERYTLDNESRYNVIARKVWHNHGAPKFRKRIISGVKFGCPETSTNGKFGMKRVIYYRYIGCEIVKTSEGIVKFELSIEE